MSRYLVQYSPAAYEDLRAIYHYIAVELMVPETAENQTARIRSAVRALDTLPYRYAAVDWEPWNSAGMRKVSVDHYVIFYCVGKDADGHDCPYLLRRSGYRRNYKITKVMQDVLPHDLFACSSSQPIS